MTHDLATRILALPESVRANLATVEGPGWEIARGMDTYWVVRAGRDTSVRGGWWPANPARAVAAVTGDGLWLAHQEISNWLYAQYNSALGTPNDDHAAALAIIEAHVTRARP